MPRGYAGESAAPLTANGEKHDCDVAVIGAGAAGMMAAATAGQRGRRVVLVDHYAKIGEKIRISGGGRCNFTNIHCTYRNFISRNLDFCRSALARYTPKHFISLVESHGIPYHEKTLGQLFCDGSSKRIIDMLVAECEKGRVEWRQPCEVRGVGHDAGGFRVETGSGALVASSLVIATGGYGDLAGVSVQVEAECHGGRFRENLLFTHRGLSGPAILQVSSYWQAAEAAEPIRINLLPGLDARAWLAEERRANATLATLLARRLPKRLAQQWCEAHGVNLPMVQLSDRAIASAVRDLTDWRVQPSGTLGYQKAEVTLGGVDTRGLSSKTMEATTVPGLYFIGEGVDVTGHLGGHNFQWAWASGYAAGEAA